MTTNANDAKPAVRRKAAAKKTSAAKVKDPAPAKAKVKVKVSGADDAKGKAKAKSRSTLLPKPADAKDKPKKAKLVRDSFTMPETEYQALGEMKKACLKAGIEVKKSELLRVGVALLRTMDVGKLSAAVKNLTPLKAGRPKKEK